MKKIISLVFICCLLAPISVFAQRAAKQKAKTYTVTIEGAPKGASVLVDQNSIKGFQATVTPGNHTFVVTAKGYDDYTVTQNITGNTTINVKLVAEQPATYVKGFFGTRFYYYQCKDVQWNVSKSKINLRSPKALYNADAGRILPESELTNGAFITFEKTDKSGKYKQILHYADGSVNKVLSKSGNIKYFGDKGFLYASDPGFCSFFYTKSGLNKDGTTPSSSSFSFNIETCDDKTLENYTFN